MDAKAFNAAHPVGTPCLYWPGSRTREGVPSRTRSEAWDLGGCIPVVQVEGRSGCIALSHIQINLQPGGGQ